MKPISRKFMSRQLEKRKSKKGNLKIQVVPAKGNLNVPYAVISFSMPVSRISFSLTVSGRTASRQFNNVTAGRYLVNITSKSCCPYCRTEGPLNPLVVAGKTSIATYRLEKCTYYRCC